MSSGNVERLFNHFKNVSEGSIKTGNTVKDELIKADAKRNLDDLVKKFSNKKDRNGNPLYPFMTISETPKEEVKTTKSKGKK